MFVASAVLASGQATVLPEPARDSGASVTGAFEGWFKNPDGSFSFLLGYYNRNRKQEVDIPVGPDNALEPGGPDRGQPTHFMPGPGLGIVHRERTGGLRRQQDHLDHRRQRQVYGDSGQPETGMGDLAFHRSGRGKYAARAEFR